MKLTISKLWETYYGLSGAASTAARQLAYAGIALVWVFRVKDMVPEDLLPAAFAFAASLTLDLLHYTIASAVWSYRARWEEKRRYRDGEDKDSEFQVPNALNYPSYLFYWSKIGAVLVGYMYILIFLIEKMH